MRVHHIFILAVMAIFFVSCNDDPATIASDIFGDNLIETDIFQSKGDEITAKNEDYKFESRTPILGFILGDLKHDRDLSNLKSSFMTEFTVSNNSIIPEMLRTETDTSIIYSKYKTTLDSLRLVISYTRNSWIGDPYSRNKISIYELDKVIPANNLTTNNLIKDTYDISKIQKLIGELEYTYELPNSLEEEARDSIWESKGNQNELSIKLDDELAQDLYSNHDNFLENDISLTSIFKGLYIKSESVDDNEGNLLSINYRSNPNIKLALNYKLHITDSIFTKKKTKIEDRDTVIIEYLDNEPRDTVAETILGIDIESNKLLYYENDYSNSSIDITQDNTDKIYLQSMGGTMAKINLNENLNNRLKTIIPNPEDNNLNNDTISLASINLTFYVDTTETDYVKGFFPEQLYLYKENEDGDLEFPSFVNNRKTSLNIFSIGALNFKNNVPFSYTFDVSIEYLAELLYENNPENQTTNLTEFYLSMHRNKDNTRIMAENFGYRRVVLHGMSIDEDDDDETIKPSNITVKYVKIK